MNRPWMDFGRTRIMSQYGIITCNWDGRFMRCVDCKFVLDGFALDWEAVLVAVAHYHEPHWFGYAKFTIKPERQAGRRTV